MATSDIADELYFIGGPEFTRFASVTYETQCIVEYTWEFDEVDDDGNVIADSTLDFSTAFATSSKYIVVYTTNPDFDLRSVRATLIGTITKSGAFDTVDFVVTFKYSCWEATLIPHYTNDPHNVDLFSTITITYMPAMLEELEGAPDCPAEFDYALDFTDFGDSLPEFVTWDLETLTITVSPTEQAQSGDYEYNLFASNDRFMVELPLTDTIVVRNKCNDETVRIADFPTLSPSASYNILQTYSYELEDVFTLTDVRCGLSVTLTEDSA